MKKVLCVVGKFGFSLIYLFWICQFNLSIEERLILFNYVCEVIKVIFIISGFCMTCANIRTLENNKASFIGVSYIFIAILIILRMGYSLWETPPQESYTVLKIGWLIHILQIVLVIMDIRYFNKSQSLKRWFFIELGLVAFMGGMAILPIPFINSLIELVGISNMEYGICIFCLCLIGVQLIGMKKILEQTYAIGRWYYKAVVVTLIVYFGLRIIGLVIRSYTVNGIIQMIDTFYYLLVCGFLYDYTIKKTWCRTSQGIKEKEEQLIDEESEIRAVNIAIRRLKQEVNIIASLAKHLKTEATKESKMKQVPYIEKMIGNCNRLKKLANNILDLDAIEKGQQQIIFNKVNLTDLMLKLFASIEPYLKNLQLTLEFDKDKNEVWCDANSQAVERILLNLISNSIKYNRQGGRIYISLETSKEEIFISVEDTGIGIEESQLQYIFNRFERLDLELNRMQEGTGLGLTIVKSLVGLHHGKVEVKSKKNEGTTVKVILPKRQSKRKATLPFESENSRQLAEQIEVEFSDLYIQEGTKC